MNILKKILKVVAFSTLLTGLLFLLNHVFTMGSERVTMQRMNDFYTEKRDTVDFVLIGTSRVFYAYQATNGWDECGVTGMTYAFPQMPSSYFPHVIEEVCKTQSPKVIVVDIQSFYKESTDMTVHYIVDYTPFSLNKLVFFKDFCTDEKGILDLSKCIPIIAFHDRFTNLQADDFVFGASGTKTGFFDATEYNNAYFKSGTNGEEILYSDYANSTDLPEEVERRVSSFMEYAEGKQIDVIFVNLPNIENDNRIATNAFKNYCEKCGYKVWDGNTEAHFCDMKLDPQSDFRDLGHLNYYGAEKFTRYFARYIKKEASLADKRKDKAFEDWDNAQIKYNKIVTERIKDSIE